MAFSRIDQLIEARNKATQEARDICDRAEAAGRDRLGPEEQTALERVTQRLGDLNGAIAQAKSEGRLRVATGDAIDRTGGVDSPYGAKNELEEVSDKLVEAIQSGRGHVTTVGHARDARGAYIMPGRESRADHPLVTTDASVTYSSYGVASLVANRLEELRYAYSGVLKAGCDVITTPGVNSLSLPKVLTNPTINMPGTEATAPSDESYWVLGKTTLAAYRHDIIVEISLEDLASTEFDAMAYLSSVILGSLAAKLANSLAVGSGTSQPKGIFKAAVTGITAASTTTFTADEVIETMNSLAAQYWPGMRAVISQPAYGVLITCKNDIGDYIFHPDLQGDCPGQLLGVPLYVDPQGPACSAGNNALIFFDPSSFHMRLGMGGQVDFEVSSDVTFKNFTRVIRAAQWMDCNMGNANAATALTLHS